MRLSPPFPPPQQWVMGSCCGAAPGRPSEVGGGTYSVRDPPPPERSFVLYGDGQIGSSCGAERRGRVWGGGCESRAVVSWGPRGRFGDPPGPTHHHQECRKPGGSPSVMFFSHRICGAERRSEPRGGAALGADVTQTVRPPRPPRGALRSPRTGTSARISGLPRAGGTHRRTAPTCRAGRGGAVTPGRRRGGAGTPRGERRRRRTRPRGRRCPGSPAAPTGRRRAGTAARGALSGAASRGDGGAGRNTVRGAPTRVTPPPRGDTAGTAPGTARGPLEDPPGGAPRGAAPGSPRAAGRTALPEPSGGRAARSPAAVRFGSVPLGALRGSPSPRCRRPRFPRRKPPRKLPRVAPSVRPSVPPFPPPRPGHSLLAGLPVGRHAAALALAVHPARPRCHRQRPAAIPAPRCASARPGPGDLETAARGRGSPQRRRRRSLPPRARLFQQRRPPHPSVPAPLLLRPRGRS